MSKSVHASNNATLLLLENVFGAGLESSQLAVVLGSAVFWEAASRVGPRIALTMLNHPPAELKHEGLSKIVKRDLEISFAGTIHAVFASAMSLWISLTPDQAIRGWELQALYAYSPRSQFLFGVSTGYFFWDLWTILTNEGQFSVPFLIHAITCIFSYWFAQKPFLHYWGCYFLLYELSTPCLHARKAMLSLDMKSWPSFASIEKAFGMIFIFARVVVGFPVSFLFWRQMHALMTSESFGPHNRYVVYFYLLANTSITGLNIYWTSLILSGFFRRAKRKDQQQGEGDKKLQ